LSKIQDHQIADLNVYCVCAKLQTDLQGFTSAKRNAVGLLY